MSEFTTGILYLAADSGKLDQSQIPAPFYVRTLNPRWMALFVDEYQVTRDLMTEWLKKLSEQFPCLYFYHAEDHGWGYQLYTKGAAAASLDVSYDLWFELTLQLVKKSIRRFSIFSHI